MDCKKISLSLNVSEYDVYATIVVILFHADMNLILDFFRFTI